MKKLINLVKENNAAKIALAWVIAPIAVIIIFAICMVAKEVFAEAWNVITYVCKVAFPTVETTVSQVINAIYHFVFGAIVAAIIAVSKMNKMQRENGKELKAVEDKAA